MPRPMSRPAVGRPLPGACDTVAAVLAVLRDAGTAMRAEQVRAALLERGVPADALRSWRGIRARLVAHDRVCVEGDRHRRTYRYLPAPPSPERALALLAGQRLPAARRAALAGIVRAALHGAAQTRPAGPPEEALHAVRALAEMAIDVEELAANEASRRAIVHTVRALAKLADLEPIERAGEVARFDPAHHTSVGGPIDDGAPVLVLRPGYLWDAPGGPVLIARAVVQDRSA